MHQTDSEASVQFLPKMCDIMAAELAVNEQGQVLIAYVRPFHDDEKPEWIEYCPETKKVWFYTPKGHYREFGVTIHKPVEKHLIKAEATANLVCVKDKQIVQAMTLPVVVQDWGTI